MTTCLTCTLLDKRNEGQRPLWDNIYRTRFWDVVHAYNTALPGWTVLVARRHVEAIADLTRDEAVELGELTIATSQALHSTTRCVKTYVVQFAEALDHPHVHFHVIPRLAHQLAEHRGPHIFRLLNVPENERVPEDTMNHVAAQIRSALSQHYPG
jgi:diadenosine tetraphosphate (Ap4A) HIT family hydrolase